MRDVKKVQNLIDIPEGHAVLNYGPVIDKEGNRKQSWLFAVGYSQNYHEPGTRESREEYDARDVWLLGIKLRTPEQAESYSRQFAKMAEEMRESEQQGQ